MNIQNNPQLQLAYDFVQYTGKNIFLTGKAGTGKTTFLHNFKNNSSKRIVVVAPTGVAALNAAGVTIHSFFQLSFGPQLPDYKTFGSTDNEKQNKIKRFSKQKINIIRSMDLLIIDEISMVRADLLDGIDNTLRRFRSKNLPFGGVQLLLIGDLQQLAPVVKDDEARLLLQYYNTPFFFSSIALSKTSYVTIELKFVYRQKDEFFINLLNKIRDNKIDNDVIKNLNARYKPNFNPDNEGYIILTTHNNKAKQINDTKLNRLPGKIHTFEAEVTGNFPEYTFPTNYELHLKVNSQVMFVKNDPNPAKEFYNGKIGTITNIDDDVITVICDGDDEPINVLPLEWEKIKYIIDEETKEIKENVEGTFTQYPLKLAWAITIHKSQGLTFEKAIIDAQSAFAHGQVYVALSRCKSLEGIVLSTPIESQSVKHDKTVESFTKNYEENQPDAAELESSKKAFQQQLLKDLFDFGNLQKLIFFSIKVFNENSSSLENNHKDIFVELNKIVKEYIIDVSVKFRNQLLYLFSKNIDIEKDSETQDRIRKAANYFSEKIKEIFFDKITNINIETDNKAVRKSVKDVLNKLLTEAIFKYSCLKACHENFNVQNYLKAKAMASLEESTFKPSRKKTTETVSTNIANPELYKQIKGWRDEKMKELDWKAYMILPLKTIRELSDSLPVTNQALKKIKGLGKKKLLLFGAELIEIIMSYCDENNIEYDTSEKPELDIKVPKKNTKQISFELWKTGKTIKDIAKVRQLTITTIEGHFAHFVGNGVIPVEIFVITEKIKLISDYFKKENFTTLTEAKSALGDEVTYGELRLVLEHLKFIKTKND